MMIPDALPLLAVGSHERGSGYACIMNALSYLNGDTVITDMPDCADPLLARLAIIANDVICTHRNGFGPPFAMVSPGVVKMWMLDADGEPAGPAVDMPAVPVMDPMAPPRVLCSDCSAKMWALGARIIGTSRVWQSPALLPDWHPARDRAEVTVRLLRFLLTARVVDLPTERLYRDFIVDEHPAAALYQMLRTLVLTLSEVTDSSYLVKQINHTAHLAYFRAAPAADAGVLRQLFGALREVTGKIIVHQNGINPEKYIWGSIREALSLCFSGMTGESAYRLVEEGVARWYTLTGWRTDTHNFTSDDVDQVRLEACLR